MTGVSFVVPVHNGEPWIADVVRAILAQRTPTPFEVVVVDDGSRDRSRAVVKQFASDERVRLMNGPSRGAAAAINAGIRAARFPLIAQIDQDVVVHADWLARLRDDVADADVGAAQGYYLNASDAGLFGRVMNLDLQQRYAAIDGETDHVCTGNTLYRADALLRVGLFDENLGYGYDNDMSYRLRAGGYRLVIDREARSVHRWREGLVAYARQQYGFGYGRLDLVAKHPSRAAGDRVSPPTMMLHPFVMVTAAACIAIGAARGGGWIVVGAALIAALFAERTVAGLRAFRRFGDAAALAFPFVHLFRDLAWSVAAIVWTIRRIARREQRPTDSMTPRTERLKS